MDVNPNLNEAQFPDLGQPRPVPKPPPADSPSRLPPLPYPERTTPKNRMTIAQTIHQKEVMQQQEQGGVSRRQRNIDRMLRKKRLAQRDQPTEG